MTSSPSLSSPATPDPGSPGWGLATKLLAVVAVAFLLIFAGLGIFSFLLYQQERASAIDAMAQRTQGLATSLQQVDEAGRNAAEQSFGILRDRMPPIMFKLVESDGKPQLQHASYPVEANFDAVDAFAGLTGGVATIFQREGDDFRRISTSLKKENGQRAVDTLLDRSHPAYKSMLDGKLYLGRANLFGKSYMTRYEPIVDEGKVIGILFIGLGMGQQQEMIKKSFQLASSSTTVTMAVDMHEGAALGQIEASDKSGKLDASDPFLVAVRDAIKAGQSQGGLSHLSLDGHLPGAGPTHIAWTHFAPWDWVVVQAQRDSDAVARARKALWLLWAMVASGVVVAAVGVFVAIRRLVLLPLRGMLSDVELLHNNNYSQPLVPKSRDELGRFITALEHMRRQLSANMRQMEQSARDIDTVASEVSKGNMELGGRTDAAATSLQQTAGSMSQLTATVQQSADAARQANQLASTAAEVAARGGQVVHEVVATMDEINHSSKKIADIIGVIDSIAFQTNILALNAAVEAARAGEQGRGFAVVASEVRNLAQRSAQAAKEIKDLINTSVQKVESGSQLVKNAGNTMGEIVASVQRVTDVIAEITAAAGEQSEGISKVNVAVTQLDHMTQQNAALVEQVAAAADSLTHQTMRLQQALANYTTGNDGVPDSAILKRNPPVSTRRAALSRGEPVPQPKAAQPLPAPQRHTQADAPRLGKEGVTGALGRESSKKEAFPPIPESAKGQKSLKKLPPSNLAARGGESRLAAAPASSRPVTKATHSADGDWESF